MFMAEARYLKIVYSHFHTDKYKGDGKKNSPHSSDLDRIFIFEKKANIIRTTI